MRAGSERGRAAQGGALQSQYEPQTTPRPVASVRLYTPHCKTYCSILPETLQKQLDMLYDSLGVTTFRLGRRGVYGDGLQCCYENNVEYLVMPCECFKPRKVHLFAAETKIWTRSRREFKKRKNVKS